MENKRGTRGYAIKRDWESGGLEIMQKAFIESMLKRFGVNLTSDISPSLPVWNYSRSKRGERT